MERDTFLWGMKSPLPNAILKSWPEGDIRQRWGENPQLYSPNMGQLHSFVGGHVGVDIATKHRDPVYAAHEGTVPSHMIFNDARRPGGRELWVYSPPLDGEDFGNSQVCTVYCHLDQIVAKPGSYVKQGDLIGYEGNSGFVVSGSTEYWGNAPAGVGTHLHFGMYERILKNGEWVQRYPRDLPLKGSSDPLPYITESAENPYGDLGGLAVVLKNIAAYLRKLAGR